LGFADVASTGTSQRLMNISINGAAALSNFDIFAAAGAQSTAVIKSIPITVTGGSITIQFTNAGGNRVPLVNNISIVSSGSPGPSLTSITPNSGTQGATVGVSLAGSNLSGATINLPTGISLSGTPTTTANSINATFVISGTAPTGPQSVTVTNGGVTSNGVTFTVNGAFTPIRINAGGSAYTDTLGHVWSADADFTAGNTNSTTTTIAGTPDQPLYQHWRYFGPGFSYVFPSIPNGSHTVTLGFADIASTGTGQRLMNISINGATVLSNFDIFAAAGAQSTAVTESIPVNVTGGSITIQFTNAGGNRVPIVNTVSIQ
jgi:hypothetical protein